MAEERRVEYERRDYTSQLSEHEATLRVHESRLSGLEREHRRLTESHHMIDVAMNDIKITLARLTDDMRDHVLLIESHIKSALLEHEKREFANHRLVLVWVITVLISAIGSVVFMLYEHLFGV